MATTLTAHRPALAPQEDYTGPKRALILAGGGMRVAYHAGALLALEQAGLRFSHIDGTSGGVINTAMVLSGLSPTEMCDRWRSFNVCNFTRKTNEAIPNQRVDLDLMIAGMSLPMFMPPVRKGDVWYTDSVWLKDANLTEAVQRGADELWVLWIINNTPEYKAGFFNQYVHMIEMSANGSLIDEFERINELNDRIS